MKKTLKTNLSVYILKTMLCLFPSLFRQGGPIESKLFFFFSTEALITKVSKIVQLWTQNNIYIDTDQEYSSV